MNQKLMDQISRISKFTYLLNENDKLECLVNQDKNNIHLILYEDEILQIDKLIDNIKYKSEEFVYKEINILCDKLILYRDKYNNN